jgi:transketolase
VLPRPAQAHVEELLANPQKVATRKASEMALEAINTLLPETIGGSADLTGSNNTLTKGLGRCPRAPMRGATSITASASSAWLRR